MAIYDINLVLHSLNTHCIKGMKLKYMLLLSTPKRHLIFSVRNISWFNLIQSGVRGKRLDIIQSMFRNIEIFNKRNLKMF